MTKTLPALLAWFALPCLAQATLPLSEYLAAFREKNPGYRALEQRIQAASLDAAKADLLTSTDLIGQAQLSLDEKLPTFPFFNYGALNTWNTAVGVEHTAAFGLRSRLTYEIDRYKYKNLLLDPALGSQTVSLMDARPVLALELPLWKDGFGRKITLQKRMTTRTTDATRLALEAERENLEIAAERTYHQLSALRDFVRTHELAREQTRAIQDYIQKRVGMNLMDRADLYQAQAQLELEELEIEGARKDLSIIEKEFNDFRGAPLQDSPPPVDALVATIDESSLQELRGVSLEYLAARTRTDMEATQGGLSRNDTLPSLDLRSSFALNGRDDDLSSVLGDSFSSDRTTFTVGLMLRVPLDVRTNAKIRQGADLSVAAAKQTQESIARRNVADQGIILDRAREAARRLVLSETIAKTQRKKLDLEKVRLRQGRTTTYQVLLFERDLLLSDLRAIQAKLDWAILRTELRRFNHTQEGKTS